VEKVASGLWVQFRILKGRKKLSWDQAGLCEIGSKHLKGRYEKYHKGGDRGINVKSSL